MKTLRNSLKIFVIAITCFFSCNDDDLPNQHPTSNVARFEKAEQRIKENEDETTVRILFSKPMVKAGEMTLKFNKPIGSILKSFPETVDESLKLPVTRGDTSVTFQILPIDNDVNDGDRSITLAFDQLLENTTPGNPRTMLLTIADDDGEGGESLVNFIDKSVVLNETATHGAEYMIHFSEPVSDQAQIRIAVNSDKGLYNVHYNSFPASEDGFITLDVKQSSKTVKFQVFPIANTNVTGDLSVRFTISDISGPIKKGNILEQTVIIRDDELSQMPRGYEITTNHDVYKRFYEYDEYKRISKVNWESYTPYYRNGADLYYYENDGKLTRVSKHAGKEIRYKWTGERIVKMEEVDEGVVNAYTEFDYDAHGNISGSLSYHLMDNGEYARKFLNVYLYFPDGNIYKAMTYAYIEQHRDPEVVSTKTYDNYLTVENFFPMIEILPGVKSQTKLPGAYRLEEGGVDVEYSLTYDYRPDGLPEKRIARSGSETQTAIYYYY